MPSRIKREVLELLARRMGDTPEVTAEEAGLSEEEMAALRERQELTETGLEPPPPQQGAAFAGPEGQVQYASDREAAAKMADASRTVDKAQAAERVRALREAGATLGATARQHGLPGMFPSSSKTGMPANTGPRETEVTVGDITIEEPEAQVTPVKTKARKNPLAGAFAENEKALLGEAFKSAQRDPALDEAFSKAQQTPEPGDAEPAQEPAAVDPRKRQQVPSENRSNASPVDERPKFAALQGVIENIWKMGGQEAPKGGFYQEQLKLGEEQARFGEAEKGRRAKALEEFLTRKFTGEQNDLNRGVQTAHNRATEEQARATMEGLQANRQALDEDRDAARAQAAEQAALNRDARRQNVIIQVGAAKDARAEKATAGFEKDMPGEEVVGAMSRIQNRIQDPNPPQGWEEGKAFDIAGQVPVLGAPFKFMGNAMRKGTEAEGVMQDALTGIQDYGHRVSGTAMSDDERAQIERRLGAAAGQSWGAFRRAFQNEIDSINSRSQRRFNALSPEAQKKVQERGIFQPGGKQIGAAESTGYAPRFEVKGNPAVGLPSQQLAEWLIQKFGKVPEDFAQKKGIYAKQAMDDPNFREQVKKNEGID